MTDLARRAVLRGSALTAMAAAAGTPVSAQSDDIGHLLRDGKLSGPLLTVADRAILKGLTGLSAGQIVYLAEGAREGFFKCIGGASSQWDDPLEGVVVRSNGHGVHFERLWDGIHGRPEWFGATVNDGNFDCADALEACYALCPVTQLAQADYFIRRTIYFARNSRTFRGVGNWARGAGRGTRIILHSSAPGLHTDHIMVVGSIAKPVIDSESYPTENHFSNFTLMRDGACTPHDSGDPQHYPSGLRAGFLFHCTFRQITSLESSVGVYIGGVVYTTFDDCYVIRRNPGTDRRNDFNIGYLLNGLISFGYAGGNASLYLNRCSAADQNALHSSPVALLAKGAFVDTFIDNFESARISTGIAFSVEGQRSIGQTVDVHIRNAIIDGCAKYGIDLNLDATSSAVVEIIDPYIYAVGGSGGERGIAVHDGAGLVTITGGQVHGDFRGGSLYFSRTRAVRVQGTKIQQASKPVAVDEASALVLEPQINNYQKTSSDFAINCRNLSRSIVRPAIISAAGAGFKGGIRLEGASDHNEIDGSAIDPGCFVAPVAGNKVWFNGGDARNGSTGAAFNAAGNRLVGVTD